MIRIIIIILLSWMLFTAYTVQRIASTTKAVTMSKLFFNLILRFPLNPFLLPDKNVQFNFSDDKKNINMVFYDNDKDVILSRIIILE